MKILNFGSINIDNFFSVDHIVRDGETIDSKFYEEKLGGKGLNQSIALAKVSKDVYHAGKLNIKDDFILEYLKENKVDTRYIKKTQALTGSAFIQVDKNGENSIVLDHGANYQMDYQFIDEVLNNFERGDILLIQNEINNLAYLIDKAFDKGMFIVLNPSPINEALLNLDLNKLNMLIMNEGEAKDICKLNLEEEIIEKLKTYYKNLKVVITYGKSGSIYFDSAITLRQKAYKVDVVDTTGAGDTFTGFLVGLMANDYPIKAALNYAALAASLAVKVKGASNSIPNFDKVEEFLKESI
ncbi:MAG: PfkB family carbohydrate kinase [Peptoniphilaceae bacterium]|nr:PfkB family carbohydrate kinase [Peptoniphilaceae bacterium]MDY6018473.1 PfkB family carbohydrate kinase [Anaerococcus sp.]